MDAGQSGSPRKRGFDSLGGGMIPLKRPLYSGTSNFDSLGGGMIPPLKRGADRAATLADRDTLDDLSIGVKSRRRFDSLGGGYIPVRRRRYFDSLGGGMIPPKKH